MLDETFILETPPWCAGWATVGVQTEVPIIGNHARRVSHGTLKVTSGPGECLIPEPWTASASQAFWRPVRPAWRGWHIVLCADRGSPHTAKARRALAAASGVEVRWRPTATPELHAGEGLWRGAQGSRLANPLLRRLTLLADTFWISRHDNDCRWPACWRGTFD